MLFALPSAFNVVCIAFGKTLVTSFLKIFLVIVKSVEKFLFKNKSSLSLLVKLYYLSCIKL